MAFDPKLSQIKEVQAAFDDDNFSGASTPEGKRRHILLHLGKCLGKLAGVEEQVDHGVTDTTVVRDEVIPDLIVFAAQLAEIENVELNDAYSNRLRLVAERNGTGIQSAETAFRSVD